VEGIRHIEGLLKEAKKNNKKCAFGAK